MRTSPRLKQQSGSVVLLPTFVRATACALGALGVLLGVAQPALAQPATTPAAPRQAPAEKPPAKPPVSSKPPAAGKAPGDKTAAAPPPTGAAAPASPAVAPAPAAAAGAELGAAPEPPVAQPAPPPPKRDDAPLVPPTAAAPPTAATPVAAPEPEKAPPKERGPSEPGDVPAQPSDVFAEDWWTQARPVFEIHGYYRVRAELFHKFALGRFDDPGNELWPQPSDNEYQAPKSKQQVTLCGPDPGQPQACQNNTQAGANMRFRLNPELHISDNVRVMSQIDLLDNVVLGSTPDGYANTPAGTSSGYQVVGRGGYAPLGAFSSTQWTPTAGVNSDRNSIAVKRVWGEYMTPVGMLRFGRMPSHWGLGMLANSGDGHDSDYASTADRIMFVTGYKKLDLYFAGMWDFANEGPISYSLAEQQGQPYDRSQLDDVNQYGLVAVRKRDPQLQRLELARGEAVINGGAYFVFRNQTLANDDTALSKGASIGQTSSNVSSGYVRRGATAYIPDLWLQFLYRKFRFEAEAAAIMGTIENTTRTGGAGTDFINKNDPTQNGWKIQQFGLATQSEFRAIEDKLHIGFGFGYATGDPDVASIAPQGEGLQPQLTRDRTFSTFRFHPDYRVDMILFRNILTRVQGAYYFKPEVSYDFARDKNGQRLGGGAALIWSRASQFIQTPGHARDLGVELNFQIYYQAKDGTLNDNPDKMGGFFTSLQYGVLFPLAGLGYLPTQVSQAAGVTTLDTSTAQILRWYMGIFF